MVLLDFEVFAEDDLENFHMTITSFASIIKVERTWEEIQNFGVTAKEAMKGKKFPNLIPPKGFEDVS